MIKAKSLFEKEILIINYQNEVYRKLDIVRDRIIVLNSELSISKSDIGLMNIYRMEYEEFIKLNDILRNLNETLQSLQQRKKNPPASKFFS